MIRVMQPLLWESTTIFLHRKKKGRKGRGGGKSR